MTLEEYQERITSLLDQHIDNLTDDPSKCLDSYMWLMDATNALIKDYYGSMKRKGSDE